MLPSPPLTADSCSPPASLKRTYSDATDDAHTPPTTPPPLKRRRCPSSVSYPAAQQDISEVSSLCFDPATLTTPPEYTHVPYDPDFGRKVCKQYRKSLIAQRACDAVTVAARKQKYGEEAALAYSPGLTPDHVRRSYEDEQRRLDEAFAEIIANSESEREPEHETEARIQSGGLGSKLMDDRRAEFMMKNTNNPLRPTTISRDDAHPQLKHIQPCGQQQDSAVISLPMSSSSYIQQYHYHHHHHHHHHHQHQHGVVIAGFRSSIDASCQARAQTAFRISSLRKKHRLREQHRSSLMVGS